MGGSAAAIAGIAVLGLDGCVASTLWKDQFAWDHSWDAADQGLVTYQAPDTTQDPNNPYKLPAATRVDTVPDPSGARPMYRDDGSYMGLFLSPAAPGPLWNSTTPAFGGRASWESDIILEDTQFFYNFHSLLAPLTNKDDTTQWFGWAQPWWGAMLVAPKPGSVDRERTALDGNPGMTTIGFDDPAAVDPGVNISTWNSVDGVIDFGPFIRTDVVPADGQAISIMWQVGSPSASPAIPSWLEVGYIDGSGTYASQRVEGEQGAANTLDTLHSGWSHMNLTSCIGLSRTLPDQSQVNDVKFWLAQQLPTTPATTTTTGA